MDSVAQAIEYRIGCGDASSVAIRTLGNTGRDGHPGPRLQFVDYRPNDPRTHPRPPCCFRQPAPNVGCDDPLQCIQPVAPASTNGDAGIRDVTDAQLKNWSAMPWVIAARRVLLTPLVR